MYNAKMAIIGERSMAPAIGGTTRRIGSTIGALIRARSYTTGFSGSGLTQLRSALNKTT